DQYLLQVIERGELSSLLSLSSEKLDEAGETELLTWYTVFGAIGNTRGQVLSYQRPGTTALGSSTSRSSCHSRARHRWDRCGRRQTLRPPATATTNFPNRSLTISIDCSTLCG